MMGWSNIRLTSEACMTCFRTQFCRSVMYTLTVLYRCYTPPFRLNRMSRPAGAEPAIIGLWMNEMEFNPTFRGLMFVSLNHNLSYLCFNSRPDSRYNSCIFVCVIAGQQMSRPPHLQKEDYSTSGSQRAPACSSAQRECSCPGQFFRLPWENTTDFCWHRVNAAVVKQGWVCTNRLVHFIKY